VQLAPGVVLLRGALDLDAQNALVARCRDDGAGAGGFATPRAAADGQGALRLQMFCYGSHWNASSASSQAYSRGPPGGPPCAPIPPELWALVADAAAEARCACASLPEAKPGVCLVNYYAHSGRLGYHQDTSERPETLRAGAPVVSVSVGDAADFAFCEGHPDAAAPGLPKPQVVKLESGDVLVFGGPARLCFHSVLRVHRGGRPAGLRMIPGRLNLTFREL
jgi:alkylated DNA repair dioxygenase AlkB